MSPFASNCNVAVLLLWWVWSESVGFLTSVFSRWVLSLSNCGSVAVSPRTVWIRGVGAEGSFVCLLCILMRACKGAGRSFSCERATAAPLKKWSMLYFNVCPQETRAHKNTPWKHLCLCKRGLDRTPRVCCFSLVLEKNETTFVTFLKIELPSEVKIFCFYTWSWIRLLSFISGTDCV